MKGYQIMLKRMLKRLKNIEANTLATLALRLGSGSAESFRPGMARRLLFCLFAWPCRVLTYILKSGEYSENTLNKYRLQILIGFLLRYLNKGIDTVISDHSVRLYCLLLKKFLPCILAHVWSLIMINSRCLKMHFLCVTSIATL